VVSVSTSVSATGWLYEPRSDAGMHFLEDDGTWRRTSYEELAGKVAAMAEILRQLGLAGQRLGLIGQTSEDFVVQLFATLATGGTCVSLPYFLAGQDRTAHDAQVATILRAARPDSVLIVGSADPVARWPSVRVPVYGQLSPPPRAQLTTSGAPALIQFTSGTAGPSKCVRIGRRKLDLGIASSAAWMGVSRADRLATPLPASMAGAVIWPVAEQIDTMLMTPRQFVDRPDRWLRCFGELGCTYSIAASVAYHHVATTVPPETLTGCRFDDWRVAVSFGEPVRTGDIDRFVAAFGPLGFRRRAFCPGYGITEAPMFVAATRPDEDVVELAERDDRPRDSPANLMDEVVHGSPADRIVSVGRPLDGVRVSIRLPDGSEAPEGVLGEVWVGGNTLAEGYEPDDDFGEWHATGDAGCLRDGALFVFGRLVDSFNLRGTLILAEQAERIVQEELPDAGAVVVVPNRVNGAGITVVVESAAPWPPERTAEARRAVSGRFHQTEVDLLVVAPGGIPRTPIGKPKRPECWSRYVLARA
jgi:acyl-CoA synthetase (AMP-forming)/AMP-acid ligase II